MDTADRFSLKKLTTDRLQVLTMGTVALVTMLILAIGSEAHRTVYQMAVVLLNGAAVLFVSTWLREELEPIGKKLAELGALFLGWMAVMTAADLLRITHIVNDGLRFSLYTPFLEYLMLLPFAAVRQEKKKYRGLELMGGAFVGGAILLLVMFAMQTFNIIPEGLGDILGRGSYEMRVAWLANIYASVFLIAIGFQIFFLCSTRNRWLKLLLLLLMVPEYCAIALTQARAVIFLSACVSAAAVFFSIYPGGLRKKDLLYLVLGTIAAGLVLAGLVCGMQALSTMRDVRLYVIRQEYLDEVPQMFASIKKYLLVSLTAWLAVIPFLIFAYSRRLQAFRARRPVLSGGICFLILVVLCLVCLAVLNPQKVSAQEESTEVVQTLAESQQNAEEEEPPLTVMDIMTKIFKSRAIIWREVFREIGKNPRILLFGLPSGEEIHMHYDVRVTSNAHNSWLQTLVHTGLPGLLLALLLSWAAVKNALQLMFSTWATMAQKSIGILIIAILGAEFFESSLFFAPCPDHFPNLAFLLCVGYAVYWVHSVRKKAHK